MEAPRNTTVRCSKAGRVLRAATFLAWGCVGLPALSAQTPAPPQTPPQIERWYGHRRMPAPQPPAPAPVAAPVETKMEPQPRILRGKTVVWPIDWFFSNTVIFEVETPPQVVQADVKHQEPGLFPPPPETLVAPVQFVTATSGEAVVQAAFTVVPQELPVIEAAAPAKSTEVASLLTTARPQAAPGLATEQNDTLFYRMAFLQLLTTLAAFVVGPVVLLIMLRLLLRKVLASNGHLRIELLNQPQLALVGGYPGMMPAGSLSAATESTAPAAPPVEEKEEEFTGEFFDLGPTFEEEKILIEEQLKQQEKALMAKIAQENVALQQQIIALGSDAAPASQETLSVCTEDAMPPAPVVASGPALPVMTYAAPVIPPVEAPALASDEVQPTDALFAAIANRTARRNAA